MLNGKIILITGASRGIGAETARILSEYNATVIINYNKNKEGAENIVSAITNRNNRLQCIAISADISKEKEAKKMVARIIGDFKNIDILINNASASLTLQSYQSVETLKWSSFQNHLDVSLRGAFHVIKYVLPTMLQEKKGKIINIISSCTVGVPPAKPIDYISSKYALLGFSKSLALQLAPFGITVNCVSPGMTETDMIKKLPKRLKEITVDQIPLKRLAAPADIANVITFLCSNASDYMTGTNIPVCGGVVM